MNNPERCFSVQIGRHCVVESVYMCEGEGEGEMGAWRSGDSSFPIVLHGGQKYLQCQEVF